VGYDSVKNQQLKLREADRVHVDLSAFLTLESSLELPVVVTDLSTCGFSCRADERLTIGSRVMLQVPNLGEFLATIIWQLGDNAGARFEPPLPVTRVMSIILTAVQEQRSIQEAGESSPNAA